MFVPEVSMICFTNLFCYEFVFFLVLQVESFLESKFLPVNALLILDNAPSHPPEDQLVKFTKDGKIWTIFMPPNVTPLIQPMNQNAIHLVKLQYRNSLLSKIISSGADDITIFLKYLNLYDATCNDKSCLEKFKSGYVGKLLQ